MDSIAFVHGRIWSYQRALNQKVKASGHVHSSSCSSESKYSDIDCSDDDDMESDDGSDIISS